MIENGIDHLFRHQYGKMVSILTRIFGLEHLETVEDAIQDTFIKALKAWRIKEPENPGAWLMQAAKNRVFDLIRKLSAEQKRLPLLDKGPSSIAINELFLNSEIADSQLRMIFTACHPSLQIGDQIAFALKTISGFSTHEIAGALLLKEDTVKKRLSRARKAIQKEEVNFAIPQGADLPLRLRTVLRVIYLIFNEGFHSGQQNQLIREELCGEALRLCRMLMDNSFTKAPDVYALFALFCFQAARLRSKINEQHEIISLELQDRSIWDKELIKLGHKSMHQAVETDDYSVYHYEAAIVAEHIGAKTYADTNWHRIYRWYVQLNQIQPSTFNQLNMAMAQLQRDELKDCYALLQSIDPASLEQRTYLYHGLLAEYYHKTGHNAQCILHLDKAISLVRNEAEKKHLQLRREAVSYPKGLHS